MSFYLRCLSLLLPLHLRYEWAREWCAELWHLRQEIDSPIRREVESLRFVRGALADVLALRDVSGIRFPEWCRDPLSLQVLSVTTAICLGLALAVPASRQLLLTPEYAASGDVVLLKEHFHKNVSATEFADWSHRRQSLFRQIAFYSVSQRRVERTGLRVAVATPNLFPALEIVLPPSIPGTVLLTRSAQEKLGHPVEVTIGGQRYKVAGALPETTLHLPENPEAFLFTQNIPIGMHGHVVAQRTRHGADLRWGLTLLHFRAKDSHLLCTPIAMLTPMPIRAFVFALLLALLALPASGPLSLRDTPLDHRELPFKLRLRSAGFLLSQMLLLVSSAGLLSLVLSGLVHVEHQSDASLVQAVLAFVLMLPAMRIVLHDHRNRCPHCHRALTHAAQVGQPSTSFLNWYGVELACSQGHGLAHVPHLPTTWFPAPRWTPLDASWAALFSD